MTKGTPHDRARAYRTAQTGSKRHIFAFFGPGNSWQCTEACVREGCPCWCHTPSDSISKIGRNFS